MAAECSLPELSAAVAAAAASSRRPELCRFQPSLRIRSLLSPNLRHRKRTRASKRRSSSSTPSASTFSPSPPRIPACYQLLWKISAPPQTSSSPPAASPPPICGGSAECARRCSPPADPARWHRSSPFSSARPASTASPASAVPSAAAPASLSPTSPPASALLSTFSRCSASKKSAAATPPSSPAVSRTSSCPASTSYRAWDSRRTKREPWCGDSRSSSATASPGTSSRSSISSPSRCSGAYRSSENSLNSSPSASVAGSSPAIAIAPSSASRSPSQLFSNPVTTSSSPASSPVSAPPRRSEDPLSGAIPPALTSSRVYDAYDSDQGRNFFCNNQASETEVLVQRRSHVVQQTGLLVGGDLLHGQLRARSQVRRLVPLVLQPEENPLEAPENLQRGDGEDGEMIMPKMGGELVSPGAAEHQIAPNHPVEDLIRNPKDDRYQKEEEEDRCQSTNP